MDALFILVQNSMKEDILIDMKEDILIEKMI